MGLSGTGTLGYSDTFEQYDPNDDRPIKTSGYYDLTQVVKVMQQEEVAETNPEELSEVLNLYRSQLRINAQRTSLEEIKEASRETTPTHSQASLPTTGFTSSTTSTSTSMPIDRGANLRQQCISTLGEEKFNEVYAFMSGHRRLETDDERVRPSQILQEAKGRFGRNATSYCMLVDQLLFKEGF